MMGEYKFFFCCIAMIISSALFAQELNESKICKQFQTSPNLSAIFIDDKTGKSIENINLGNIKYKDLPKEFTFNHQSRLITRKRLIPHGEPSNYRYIEFVKTNPKFKCNSTNEYMAIIHLRTNQASVGKFAIDYQINIEDPSAEEPTDFIGTINTKLIGTFVGND